MSALPALHSSLDRIQEWAEPYRKSFTLPDYDTTLRLAQEAATTFAFHITNDRLATAMQAMQSPWLDRTRMVESVNAFSHLQVIGSGVRLRPFELDFTTSLRSRFGDWRDVNTVPPTILNDAVARIDFYVEHGFDSSLIEFPEDAFEEATDLAGLAAEVGEAEGVNLELHDRCYYYISRLEYRLRLYIERVMSESFGVDWPGKKVPDFARRWEETKQKRLKEGQPERPTLTQLSLLAPSGDDFGGVKA